MNDATDRLTLPMIVPGQAQKEMTHNEALVLLDAAVQASVAAAGVEVPPPDPEAGTCWIVGDAPSGAWTGHARDIAMWTAAGWRFVAPTPGFRAWVADEGSDIRFVDGAWIVGTTTRRLLLAGTEILSSPADPIADPVGGATVDTEARAAIAAILAALRHHNLLDAA